MRVLVFGATGRVGANVVQYALDAGDSVTAFVRNAAKITLKNDALTVVEGDIYTAESIIEALQPGFDAAVNTIGADPFKPATVVTDSARVIVGAMEKSPVRRYLGITGTAQMPPEGIGGITDAILARSPIRYAVRDHATAITLVTASALNWTLAGCPYIKDGTHTGIYHRESRFPGGFKTISPQDVADFLVKELHDNRYPRQIVGIWY